jgi:hypothetical protein
LSGKGQSAEKLKKGFSGWIIITSMAMRDSPVVTLESLLRHFIGGRIALIVMI